MAKWSDVRDRAKRPRDFATVATAQDLCNEHARLEVALKHARDVDEQSNEDDTAPAIAARMLELEEQIAASEWTFTFEALERGAYRRLLAAHRPTEEQATVASEAGFTQLYDSETYPPALMAKSAVSVTMADGEEIEGVDWAEIWETWSTGQVAKIWAACQAANAGVADVPKSTAASVLIAGSAKS